MTHNVRGPRPLPDGATPKAVTQVIFYPTRRGEQARRDYKLAEQRLCAAGWSDPVQLACDSDRLGLLESDFGDRLCGVVVSFLRACGQGGRIPTLAGAEAVLDEFAVLRDNDELLFVLIDTPAPKGDSFADLIGNVLKGSEERGADLFRKLTYDALRELKHAFECPRCIACAQGKRVPSDRRPSAQVARRVVYV